MLLRLLPACPQSWRRFGLVIPVDFRDTMDGAKWGETQTPVFVRFPGSSSFSIQPRTFGSDGRLPG